MALMSMHMSLQMRCPNSQVCAPCGSHLMTSDVKRLLTRILSTCLPSAHRISCRSDSPRLLMLLKVLDAGASPCPSMQTTSTDCISPAKTNAAVSETSTDYSLLSRSHSKGARKFPMTAHSYFQHCHSFSGQYLQVDDCHDSQTQHWHACCLHGMK